MQDAADALARFIGKHPRLLVLTGAGISTGSGIPDYRDKDGNWKRNKGPIQYQEFVSGDPAQKRYWARSMAGWPQFHAARPNAAHRALAKLESAGCFSDLITQNVDRLHQRAGSRNVIDLHGRLDVVGCLDCGQTEDRDDFQTRLQENNPDWLHETQQINPDGDVELGNVDYERFVLARCKHCRGPMKPRVVFFGESIPGDIGREATRLSDEADALLVIGSSLMVFSGFRFARQMAQTGRPVAAVNLGKTRADDLIDLKIQREASELLSEVAESLTGTA